MLTLSGPGWRTWLTGGRDLRSCRVADMAGTRASPSLPAGEVMSLAIAVAVFPVIFIGELPDKTMFASLVLSTHGRPLRVWLGGGGGLAVPLGVAVGVGGGLVPVLPPP